MLPSGMALRMPAVVVGDKAAVAGRAPGCSAATPGTAAAPVPCRAGTRARRCVTSTATRVAAPPSTVVKWDDEKPAPPPNPAREARRAELLALTLDKGLKPLCRDYDLKATGTKARCVCVELTARLRPLTGLRPPRPPASASVVSHRQAVLVDRILDHEFAPGGTKAKVAVEAARAAVRDASSDLVAAIQALLADSRRDDTPVTPADVTSYLELFARTVERLYPALEQLPAGSALEGVPRHRRSARCVLDPQRGTLRVLADLLDDVTGGVQASRDDTAVFAASLLTPRGGPSKFSKELCTAFEEARRQLAKAAQVARLAEAAGEVLEAEFLRDTPAGWKVLLLPSRVTALLPRAEEDRTDELAPGAVLPVVVLPSDAGARIEKPQRGPPPPGVRVSRRDPALVLGLMCRYCPDLATGGVRVVATQRVAGRITKVAVVNADPADGRNPRVRVLGEGYTALEAARRQLHPPGGRESFQIIDATGAAEDPQSFVGASLWPARIGRIVMAGEGGGDAVVYVASDEDMAKAIGKGGGNLAAASWLCRKVLGDAAPRNMVVKSPAEAEQDGVELGRPPAARKASPRWPSSGRRELGGSHDRAVGSWDDILGGKSDDNDLSGWPFATPAAPATPGRSFQARGKGANRQPDGVGARPARQPSKASDEALFAQLGVSAGGFDAPAGGLWSGLDGAGGYGEADDLLRLEESDSAAFDELDEDK